MRSYYEYADRIYKNHLKEVKKEPSLELTCRQAGKVSDERHRLNCQIGPFPSPDQYDHTLAYFIAS